MLAAGAGAASAQDLGGLLQDVSSAIEGGGPKSAGDDGATLSGRLLQVLALTTVLSVAPGLLVMMTSFTRFVIVLSILRSALGLAQTPPNVVLTSMALFLTFFVMQPVFEDAWEDGLRPLLDDAITEEQAVARIAAPFHAFMEANTRPEDLALFEGIAARTADASPPRGATNGPGWRELVPAFAISELRQAFTIGFLLFLPFLAIDLIVASILMSAGMMMLPPVLISLPFKIVFFVLIDGWAMLAGSLIESYLPAAPI
nr:flagellar type III secretion system pore protein FliP [Jannaschia sp. Os4]